jgi:hypothetical protein
MRIGEKIMKKTNLYTVTAHATTTDRKYGFTGTTEWTLLIIAKNRPQAYKKMYRAVVARAKRFEEDINKINFGNAFEFDYEEAVRIAKRTGGKVL